jgi:hypothetical protein
MRDASRPVQTHVYVAAEIVTFFDTLVSICLIFTLSRAFA